ncbi:hypothetical protein B0T25DRAFT_581490 [Lasiosphaeria hispida]|uniref:BZIP domain-containing protein n=1 Tax=Lasiosphaeria hispida TaxID=260671 RepID=A0AAJ0MES9_9PEZI|nr:hypothetical protein B0T25DRAFT_581490 [Lasiosphaeria hispida]
MSTTNAASGDINSTSEPRQESRPKPRRKTRGRPRKQDDEADQHIKNRRARNREAQLVFRVRKQASQQSQEQKIKQLENTIERMGSAFLDLADNMLQSNVVTQDRNLMQKLGKTTENIVELARELEEENDEHDTPSPALVEQNLGFDMAMPTLPTAWPDPTFPVNFPSPVDTSYQLDWPPGPSQPVPATLNPNIFGNGWFGQVATSFTSLPPLTPQHPSTTDNPLGFKIIHTTLQVVYHALFGTPQAPADDTFRRVFAYSLRYHSRDELLFNIRWFLGPGYLEMYRLGNISFVTSPFAQVFRAATEDKRIGELDPAVDVDAFREVVPVGEGESYVNANAVEMYLWDKGVRFQGENDVVEVSLDDDEVGRHMRPWDFVNFDAFFIGDRSLSSRAGDAGQAGWQNPRPHAMWVSQARLLINLVEISVCLASGPGYQRAMIDRAIAASVVEAAA